MQLKTIYIKNKRETWIRQTFFVCHSLSVGVKCLTEIYSTLSRMLQAILGHDHIQ